MNLFFKTLLLTSLFALPSVAQDKEKNTADNTADNAAKSIGESQAERAQQTREVYAFLDEHFPEMKAELNAVLKNEGVAAYEAVYTEQVSIFQHYRRTLGFGGKEMAMLVVEQNKMYKELQVLLDRYEALDADDPARAEARANAEPLLAKSNTFGGEWKKLQIAQMKKRKVPLKNQEKMIAAMERKVEELAALRANPQKVFDDYVASRQETLKAAKETKKKLPSNWHIDPKEAMAAAQKSGKPVHVFCSTSWCGPCRGMVQDVFPQESVQKALEGFEPLYADGDLYGVFCRKYHVRTFPTSIIINAEGEFLHRCESGGMNAEQFIEWLDKKK